MTNYLLNMVANIEKSTHFWYFTITKTDSESTKVVKI